MLVTVTQINHYPVKSLKGISLNAGILNERGLPFDRQWLVVDHNNRFVTQREIGAMALISVNVEEDALKLTHPEKGSCRVPFEQESSATETVRIWKDDCEALVMPPAINHWLSESLGDYKGGALRLVRFPENEIRMADPGHLQGTYSEVAFADAYPYLIANQATLDQLNTKLQDAGHEVVPMNRFRPNIVIRGLDALQEHRTAKLRHPDKGITLALKKPCKRCKITTINQDNGTAAENFQPLRTLVQSNPFPDLAGGFFGENAILEAGAGATLAVGDELEVLN